MDIKLNDGRSIKVNVIENEDMYEYYIKNVKIGVYDPKVMEDNIIILQNTLENELSAQIKDGINCLSKEQLKMEANTNKKIEEYAEEMGIERNQLKDITVIELDRKNKDINKEENNKNNEKDSIKGKEIESEKVKTNDVNIQQEISLFERANDMKDLKRWLGANIPSEFIKVGVINSDQMDVMKDEKGNSYKNNSTRYSLVIIDKDNNIEPLQKYIPNLRQRDSAGNNPTSLEYQVDKDGNVERDAVLSEYEIGNKILQIDNKEMGRVEVNIGQEAHGNTDSVNIQMRDQNTIYATDTEDRRVIGEYEENGEYTVDENIKEAKQHGDCDKMTSKDIDGDKDTSSHIHIENMDDIYLGECVKEILKNDVIASNYGRDYIKKEILEKIEEKEYLSTEELIEDVEKQLEEQANYEHEEIEHDRNIG